MIEKVKNILLKYKEQMLYLVFGVITTLTNWVVYTLAVKIFGINISISNAIAWCIAVIVAYITNKLYVFESKSWNKSIIFKELSLFLGSRILSGIIEVGGFPVLYYIGLNQSILGIDGFIAKLVISVFVVVLNYVLSKIFVFKEKQTNNRAEK